MEKTFLITGTPSKLTIDVAHECLSGKHNVLLTLEPGTEAPPIPSGLEQNLQYIEWNRRSPISARFVLLQAYNKQIDIDHAVLVFAPRSDRGVFHEANAAFFEERIDYDIKGFLFMVKELLAYFQKQKKGSMTVVIQNAGPDILPPFDALAMKSLEGLVDSLFVYYAQEAVVLRGVHARSGQNRQIAEHVLNLILEDAPKTRGKWSKYTGKTGIFNFGK